jgi:hypothetical protein
MNRLKRILRVLRILLFAFMFAVCMLLGVAPVIPNRKEQVSIEIKMEESENEELKSGKTIQYNNDQQLKP